MPRPKKQPLRQGIDLPHRPFLYTTDQIASILGVAEHTVRTEYLFYTGNEWGKPHPDLLQARNIAPSVTDREDWRVEEQEFKRWLRRKGFHTYG